MSLKSIVALCFCLATLSLPFTAFGTVGSVTIDFGGLCTPITIPQTPPFYLFAVGGEYTCTDSGGTSYFKIQDNGGNRAHVAPTSSAGLPGSSGYVNDSDGSNDVLRVRDWRITALIPTPASLPNGYQVTVSLQFGTPPDTDGAGSQPDTYYKTTLYGSITNYPGNWVKMDPGYVKNPLVGLPETTLGIYRIYYAPCTATPCTPPVANFGSTMFTSGRWPDSPNYLNGPRVLKTKFSFRLMAANHVLVVSSTGGKIQAQPNADPSQNECSLQYTKCPIFGSLISSLTEWTRITLSSAEDNESAKLDVFTKVNWASLQQDMARGGGEYLTSLATLLEVPIGKQKDFFVLAQDQYRAQAEEGVVKRGELIYRLQEAIAGRPMLFARTMDPTP